MSETATFAVPGSLDTPTGGYAYDRRMIGALRQSGWRINVLDLGEGFPHPSEAARLAALAALGSEEGEGPIIIDGLAFGVLPEAASVLSKERPLVALVHHPLAFESGLTPVQAAALRASERAALATAAQVVVTSSSTADLLAADYGVPRSRIAVVLPGTDRAPRATGSCGGGLNLLAVGSLVPRKGYDILLAALGRLRDLDWHLTIVGDAERSPQTAAALAAQVRDLGLWERVSFTGALTPEALANRYAAADLFVLSSRFEGYGMAYAEAIVRGLPVVATTAGAIPATIPPGCGVLVPPDDVAALTDALALALRDRERRRQWAEAAWRAGRAFPTWAESAERFAQVLRMAR